MSHIDRVSDTSSFEEEKIHEKQMALDILSRYIFFFSEKQKFSQIKREKITHPYPQIYVFFETRKKQAVVSDLHLSVLGYFLKFLFATKDTKFFCFCQHVILKVYFNILIRTFLF